MRQSGKGQGYRFLEYGGTQGVELDTLGMEGIGEVYRYKSGDVESDDEVALIFDPESGIALSIPLVNIRHILKLATDKGIIDGTRGRSCSELHNRYISQNGHGNE